ncbi:hypothetical protein HZ326_30857 [Fusarium oxysporum f. sp. albedinis]|nr:hypothetical protein HZ326_30857 [Fusarium oxysporum f. sp. albedinis]
MVRNTRARLKWVRLSCHSQATLALTPGPWIPSPRVQNEPTSLPCMTFPTSKGRQFSTPLTDVLHRAYVSQIKHYNS